MERAQILRIDRVIDEVRQVPRGPPVLQRCRQPHPSLRFAGAAADGHACSRLTLPSGREVLPFCRLRSCVLVAELDMIRIGKSAHERPIR
jgi:hypothetical protein